METTKLLRKVIRIFFSLPKTIYFNFYLFPFKTAIKFPVLVDFRTKFISLNRKTLILKSDVKFGIIKLGWGNGSIGNECNRFNYWNVKKNCRIVFEGSAQFAKGVSLRVDNEGEIVFGNQFTANQNFFCASNTSITFGNDVLLGWNVHIRDGDGHNIFNQEGEIINDNKPIRIGDHVWLASYASILKGSIVSEGSIVAFGSIVTKSFMEPNIIIGGIPSRIVKRNIYWKK